MIGSIRKMITSVNEGNVAQYNLPIGDGLIKLNDYIGEEINFSYTGNIRCIHCARKTKKSFNQGYCYPCLVKLAQCDMCIMKPELCHYHAGTCREPVWGETNCLNDHYVYLANTGKVKVGITRHISSEVSSRWIDQGADQALPIFRVSQRLISGLVEKEVSKHIGDKTNWRLMLKGIATKIDLLKVRNNIKEITSPFVDELINQYGIQSISNIVADPVEIKYPVIQYPSKIKSINLDKTSDVSGKLLGIKAQYLILDEDRVINMRKYAGYEINFIDNL